MELTSSGLPILSHGELRMSQSTAIEFYIVGLSPKFSRLSLKEKAIDQMYAGIKLVCGPSARSRSLQQGAC